ncbi:MAG: hypothetical protein Q4C55_07055 [Eubacterium sp.]|nr:hypothetical protein [Eubacterium sp.]
MATTNKTPAFTAFKAFTFEAHLESSKAVPEEVWREYLTGFLEDISAEVAALPGCVPGHLKLAATLAEDTGSLKLSSLGPGIPVTADGGFAAPGRRLSMVLNLLVAGVDLQALEPICMRALGRFCGRWDLTLI